MSAPARRPDGGIALDRALQQLRHALDAGDTGAARGALAELQEVLGADPDVSRHLARLMDLGELVAELTHELRQPLLGVKAYAQMIESEPASEAVADRAQAIVVQAGRMEALVERAAAYARGEAPQGDGAPRAHPVDAAQTAVALLRRRCRAADIDLQLEAASDLGPVALEPVGLQQVFVNLINNAREALAEGGGALKVVLEAGPDGLVARILDDGPGVPEEMVPRLFEPFSTTKATGTGLGLYISRRIVRSAGGDLTYHPRAQGSEFRVSLPFLTP